jgi:integrase
MTTAARPPVLDPLDRALMRVTSRPDTSAARSRQLRWVAGELRRALDHETFPKAARRDLAALFSAEPMGVYFALAARGDLRARAAPGAAASTVASIRVRMDCVEILARAAVVPVELPERPAMQELKTPVGPRQRSLLHGWLEAAADHPGADPGRVRLFALVGVVLDTGARAGELCALKVADLSPGLATVTVVRRPQARSVAPPTTEVHALNGVTQAALRHWLDVREDLIREVQGTAKSLWVSVRGNHAGVLDADGNARHRPPGMPLMPRGLARAYTRTVVQVNADMVGRPGWEPLPYRLEQLRRAIESKPREVRGAGR